MTDYERIRLENCFVFMVCIEVVFIFMLTESNNKTALLQFSCAQENFNYILLSEDIKQSSTPYVCLQ